MASRWLAVSVALSFLAVALILIAVAFGTANWLVSEHQFAGASQNRLGLWTHCYNSLPGPQDPYPRQFFIGCRWIYDPFAIRYDEVRGYKVPGFMVATQFFFTVCLICMLVGIVLTLLYFLRCGPVNGKFVLLIKIGAIIILIGAVCGAIAVIIFASLANRRGWMPGHTNNSFGWSFALACIGVVFAFVVSALLLTETNIQEKKKRQLDLQTRFELESESRT